MTDFLQLGWQVQIIVILCLTFLLGVVAIDDQAGNNLLRFISGMKKLFGKKPGKPATLVERLVALVRRFFGRDRHEE